MAFSQSGILDVQLIGDGADLFVSWKYSGLDSPLFQVYLNQKLVWVGTTQNCHLPRPPAVSTPMLWVEVGMVASSEATQDFSASLTAARGKLGRATLGWSGGTYLDSSGQDNIASFYIFQGNAPGLAVDLTAPVDTVRAYPGRCINDGFGKGGFGEAGYGRSATQYSWQSPPLTPGTWFFGISPVDLSGQYRPPGTSISVTVDAAPRPPACFPDGSRLSLNYGGPSPGQTTLTWLPSSSDVR